jgi:hypothetical protein
LNQNLDANNFEAMQHSRVSLFEEQPDTSPNSNLQLWCKEASPQEYGGIWGG